MALKTYYVKTSRYGAKSSVEEFRAKDINSFRRRLMTKYEDFYASTSPVAMVECYVYTKPDLSPASYIGRMHWEKPTNELKSKYEIYLLGKPMVVWFTRRSTSILRQDGSIWRRK